MDPLTARLLVQVKPYGDRIRAMTAHLQKMQAAALANEAAYWEECAAATAKPRAQVGGGIWEQHACSLEGFMLYLWTRSAICPACPYPTASASVVADLTCHAGLLQAQPKEACQAVPQEPAPQPPPQQPQQERQEQEQEQGQEAAGIEQLPRAEGAALPGSVSRARLCGCKRRQEDGESAVQRPKRIRPVQAPSAGASLASMAGSPAAAASPAAPSPQLPESGQNTAAALQPGQTAQSGEELCPVGTKPSPQLALEQLVRAHAALQQLDMGELLAFVHQRAGESPQAAPSAP